MNVGGVIVGTIAAVFGAVVWAAIFYYGNMEIGYLAWGIGLLVGLGVSAGSRSGGIGAAAIAIILTVLSILSGKYAAVHLAIDNIINKTVAEIQFDDNSIMMDLAEKAVVDAEAAGETLEFRNGTNTDDAARLEDYPETILKQVIEEFASMTEQEKQKSKDSLEKSFHTNIAEAKTMLIQEGFMASFSPFGILFFILGIFTAGKVALSDVVDLIDE